MSEDPSSSPVDGIVDELLPVDLDWRYLVCTYPLPAILLAAAGGFWIGRQHGQELLEAAATRLTDTVSENVEALLGGRPDADGQDAPREP